MRDWFGDPWIFASSAMAVALFVLLVIVTMKDPIDPLSGKGKSKWH